MSVPSFEELFGSCTLQVIAPDTSIAFPEPGIADDWLPTLSPSGIERRQAFFDERLRLLLIAQITYPSADVDPDPPPFLLDFLAHVQVSLEATYISQTPTTLPEPPQTPQAQAVASRTLPFVGKSRPASSHPLFPPQTPNPMPSSADRDRKYAQSEGTLLLGSIWGQKPANLSGEKFYLLYSRTRDAWLAVYELSLTVSFLRLPFSDPLLSLTVSTTLRDKAVSLSQASHPFVIFLTESGILSKLSASVMSTFSKQQTQDTDNREDDDQTGLEEVNLLEGLSTGSIAHESESLYLPSTRLGNVTRRQIFSLPPARPSSTQLSPSSSKHSPQATLRKSFRKILQTVSGFRVRMRTVFIPHILLPEVNSGSDLTNDDNEMEEREAGNNEHTVVLCVEVENSGEAGPGVGFAVERVDVKISGEGASAKLIGWGEGGLEAEIEKRTFPLLIGSMEQYNLLYAVSFLMPSTDIDFPLTGRGPRNSDLQRAVAINIYGKPYVSKIGDEHDSEDYGNPMLGYPTDTFSSRWNCILDLSSKLPEEPPEFSDHYSGVRSVLPEPASPFPGQAALASAVPTSKLQLQSIVGTKRHTLPSNIAALRAVNPTPNFRLPMASRDQSSASPISSTRQYTPPSVAMQAFSKSPSTAFGIPTTTTPSLGGSVSDGSSSESQTFITPPTPAYPAFPPIAQTASHIQAPLSSYQGVSGSSIEIRRERGVGVNAVVPQTPGPTIITSVFDPARDAPVTGGEPIIVSVGLLPTPSGSVAPRKLYPCDKFTLDIFVFNRSSWTRRFEISCPDPDRWRRRRIEQEKAARGGKTTIEELRSVMTPPGVIPLQNRVRVGPLRPSTCQSVRMDFFAMTPGVHSVEFLILTDIETGFSMNLRSAQDIVVHEHTQT